MNQFDWVSMKRVGFDVSNHECRVIYTFIWVRFKLLNDTGYRHLLEIVNILFSILYYNIPGCVWKSWMLSTASISSVHLLSPKAITAEIAISWVMLSSHDRLNWGDGFREKGGPYSFLCWNQNFYVGNPMLMKTLSLAGGGCWYPFTSVPRISHTYTLFVLLPLSASFFGCIEEPLQMVPTTPCTLPWQFVPSFLPPTPPTLSLPFLISIADSHLSVSTSNAWSGTNVQRL